eukprot:scaffold123703_cov31-Tisochrysis_lutea.AAC.1
MLWKPWAWRTKWSSFEPSKHPALRTVHRPARSDSREREGSAVCGDTESTTIAPPPPRAGKIGKLL